MVGVGRMRTMRSGFWSKRLGRKATFISKPAREPVRRGPVKSKLMYSRKTPNGKYVHARDRKKPNHKGDIYDDYKLKKNPTTRKGGRNSYARPTLPYRIHVQYDKSRNYIVHPSIRLNWARIVNRKTYDGYTGKLIEDLDVSPDLDLNVTMRTLPSHIRYIKTVFEYGGMPDNVATK